MNYTNNFPNYYAVKLGVDIKHEKYIRLPMLIVGANQYTRTLVKFNVLQEYDIHWFFMPNESTHYTLGCILLSRKYPDERPYILSTDALTTQEAFDKLSKAMSNELVGHVVGARDVNAKLLVWYTHWIYRCPKISLKDVLHLETYKNKETA